MPITSLTDLLNSPRSLPNVCTSRRRWRTWLMTETPANGPPRPQQTSTRSLAETLMRPLLGDFLVVASDHIDAATSDIPQPSVDAGRAMIKELDRLTAVMARTANAFVVDDGTDPAHLDAPALTALDAQAALRHA